MPPQDRDTWALRRLAVVARDTGLSWSRALSTFEGGWVRFSCASRTSSQMVPRAKTVQNTEALVPHIAVYLNVSAKLGCSIQGKTIV